MNSIGSYVTEKEVAERRVILFYLLVLFCVPLVFGLLIFRMTSFLVVKSKYELIAEFGQVIVLQGHTYHPQVNKIFVSDGD